MFEVFFGVETTDVVESIKKLSMYGEWKHNSVLSMSCGTDAAPATWEAEHLNTGVGDQPGLHSEVPPQEKNGAVGMGETTRDMDNKRLPFSSQCSAMFFS